MLDANFRRERLIRAGKTRCVQLLEHYRLLDRIGELSPFVQERSLTEAVLYNRRPLAAYLDKKELRLRMLLPHERSGSEVSTLVKNSNTVLF